MTVLDRYATVDSKEYVVLEAFAAEDLTAHEFWYDNNLYVNTWAPVITVLKQDGFLRETGQTRLTRFGKPAKVLTITRAGRIALDGKPL